VPSVRTPSTSKMMTLIFCARAFDMSFVPPLNGMHDSKWRSNPIV
jgi:hypothetical protein